MLDIPEDLDDGSTVDNNVNINEIEKPERKKSSKGFHDNLAEEMLAESLNRLSVFLLKNIEEDIQSRQEWIESIEVATKYLGFTLEEPKEPTEPAHFLRTFDTTMTTILMRSVAMMWAELFPDTGPVGYMIDGEESEELEDEAIRKTAARNKYLTVVDNGYYPDSKKALMYTTFYGSGFKKIWYDRNTKKTLCRFIKPRDFIIDSECTSVLESNRITHVLHLHKKDIMMNMENGIYRDVKLPYLQTTQYSKREDSEDNKSNVRYDVDPNVYTEHSEFEIYEIHTTIDLNSFASTSMNEDIEIPAPYVITIDVESKKVLSVRRNWVESDEDKKKQDYFVGWTYLPGFGLFGVGVAQLLGTNAITLTKILHRLVDAASLKNLPGGLRTKGGKAQTNDIRVGPAQFVEVDTGGVPLSEAFMPLPYSGADPVLRQLMMDIIQQCKELGSIANMDILDTKASVPVGTTLAILEHQNQIQSFALRSMHDSLSRELLLIDKVMSRAENEDEETIETFSERIRIIPVGDPSKGGKTQRIIHAESILKLAMQAPDIHNLEEIYRLNYKAQGVSVEEIDKILVKEEEVIPLDPVTEDFNMLIGKPAEVSIDQNHPAHNIVHGMFAQENQDKPDVVAAVTAHMRKHEAFQMLIEMQQLLGQPMPQPEELENIEVQNAIALAIADKLTKLQDGQEQNQPSPIDENALLMADIEQKRAEIESKERIAELNGELAMLKIESAEKIAELKVQLEMQKEAAKIESAEHLAIMKQQTEIMRQDRKDETDIAREELKNNQFE